MIDIWVRDVVCVCQASRALCRACGLKVVPCGHVYAKGELVRTSGLGKKSWDEFKSNIDAVRADVQS